MFKQYSFGRYIKNYDFKLILYVVLLTVIGIMAIGSARESVQDRQIAAAAAGLAIMLFISFIDYHLVLKLYWVIYVVNIALLGLVLVDFLGDSSGGAQRWLDLKIIRFQPSELAKILLILFFAQFIMVNKDKINTFKILVLSLILIGIPMYLVKEQPDLSTTIIIAIVFCVMMLIGGLSHKIIIGVIAIIVPVAVIFLMLVLQPEQTIIKDYQQGRILAWLHPEDYADTLAYQTNNSMMAIGSGQLTGKGYKSDETSSVKNGNFISEPHTDFIFAVIGEEWGFIGGCTVIILLFLISLECALVAWRAKDMAGHIIAAGMAGLIGFQSFINIGVTTGTLPNTGVTLPFVSYGMTSLLSLYIGLGFVINIRLQNGRN